MKIEKISKLALYVCVGVIIACFLAFFCIGYSNPVGDYNEPQLTDLLMVLMYVLFVVMLVLTVWSIVRSSLSVKGGSGNSSGVPGGKIMAFTIALLVISLAVGIVCGLGEESFTASDGTVTSAGWVTVVDMFCISSGILFLAAVVAVIVSMTGALTTVGNKQAKTIK